jgi:hypothetical protein
MMLVSRYKKYPMATADVDEGFYSDVSFLMRLWALGVL